MRGEAETNGEEEGGVCHLWTTLTHDRGKWRCREKERLPLLVMSLASLSVRRRQKGELARDSPLPQPAGFEEVVKR